MAKTTDEIYDLLIELRQEVRVYSATNNLRVSALEAKDLDRGVKRWQFWSAVAASPLAGAVLALIGIKAGV